MAYSVKQLSSEPIIIATIGADFDLANDWGSYNKDLNDLLNAMHEPAFCIADMRHAELSFDDLVAGINLSARGSKPLLKHANIREIVVVTTSSLLKLAAKGLSSVTFGNIAMKTFDDMEACLRYCRQ